MASVHLIQHSPRSAIDAGGHFAALEDCATARLLHRAMGCDVTALVSLDRGTTFAWVMTWTGASGGIQWRSRSASSLTAAVAARLPELTEAASKWPGELELAPQRGHLPPRCQLVIPLVVSLDRLIAWFLGREGGAFSVDEVDHATLLAPGLRLRLRPADIPEERPGVLTDREQAVLDLVARGLTSRAVAHRCGISERTVDKHLEHIYRKIGCSDRLTAVLRIREAGRLNPGSS
jgi:DNA-binding CsgD family transcriptional regulator